MVSVIKLKLKFWLSESKLFPTSVTQLRTNRTLLSLLAVYIKEHRLCHHKNVLATWPEHNKCTRSLEDKPSVLSHTQHHFSFCQKICVMILYSINENHLSKEPPRSDNLLKYPIVLYKNNFFALSCSCWNVPGERYGKIAHLLQLCCSGTVPLGSTVPIVYRCFHKPSISTDSMRTISCYVITYLKPETEKETKTYEIISNFVSSL